MPAQTTDQPPTHMMNAQGTWDRTPEFRAAWEAILPYMNIFTGEIVHRPDFTSVTWTKAKVALSPVLSEYDTRRADFKSRYGK